MGGQSIQLKASVLFLFIYFCYTDLKIASTKYEDDPIFVLRLFKMDPPLNRGLASNYYWQRSANDVKFTKKKMCLVYGEACFGEKYV